MSSPSPNAELRSRITALWALGLTTDRIAERLGITRNAVAGQISRMRRLGVPLHHRRRADR